MSEWNNKYLQPKKGFYAIEMEVGSNYRKNILNYFVNKGYTLIDKMGKDIYINGKKTHYDTCDSYINNKEKLVNTKHIEVFNESYNISEFNIRTNNFYEKSIIYNKIGNMTNNSKEFPIGSYSGVSGGTHLHIFLSKQGFKYVKNDFFRIKFMLLNIPFWMKMRKVKDEVLFYNRNRLYMIQAMFYGRVEFSKNHFLSLSHEHTSIEFRMNNNIHPFMFLYYYFILANKGIVEVNKKGITNVINENEGEKVYLKDMNYTLSLSYKKVIEHITLISFFAKEELPIDNKYIDEITNDFINKIKNA